LYIEKRSFLKKSALFIKHIIYLILNKEKLSKFPCFIFDRIVLRTPTFPINFFLELTDEQSIPVETLKSEWKKPLIREAIFISSKNLYNSLLLWEKGEITNNKKKKRLEQTLIKYLLRMSTRCTPFGLFAGFSNISFSDETKIVFNSNNKHERQVLLDFGYLAKLSKELLKSSIRNKNIHWFPNSSIYDNIDSIRYIESTFRDGVISLTTESVTKNEYLLKVLEHANSGITYLEIRKILIEKGLPEIDSESFLNSLIENQVLISNLEPNLTGEHYSETLQDINRVTAKLQNLKKRKDYKLENEKLPVKVDLHKTTKNSTLNEKWKQDIITCINFFNKITTRKKVARLESFKKEFSKRYGTMEMPLGRVLDVEYGMVLKY